MLLYLSPRFYEWSITRLRGPELHRRFAKIAEVVGEGSVLDVACGTGLLAGYLSDGARYSGIDLNRRFLKFSRKKGLDVAEHDVFDVDGYPEADTYVLCDLLHHVMPHHQDLLESVLSLGKTVVVCEPPEPSKSKLRRFLIRGILDNDGINPPRLDQTWFTEPELLDFFERVMAPDEMVKIGGDVIAVRRPAEA